jgi:hypothetical protein
VNLQGMSTVQRFPDIIEVAFISDSKDDLLAKEHFANWPVVLNLRAAKWLPHVHGCYFIGLAVIEHCSERTESFYHVTCPWGIGLLVDT